MAFTKLMQWLLALAAFTGVWATLVASAAQPKNILHRYEVVVLALPIILVGLFGVRYQSCLLLVQYFVLISQNTQINVS